MNTLTDKLLILNALKSLPEYIENNDLDPNVGICSYLKEITMRRVATISQFRPYYQTWPHYTGDAIYPIASAYAYHSGPHNWKGEQLTLRLSLIEHLISCIEAEL